MARVRVELPSILAQVLEGRHTVEVEGTTLAEAIADLLRRLPSLEVHLFDESGRFRQHVLCFHNRTSTRWMETPHVPLADGDTITILQAVSGG